jgi:prepilin-type N-terminal cleavage/methylation domain-containing protein
MIKTRNVIGYPKAFSLVEILVVTAILVVLMGIYFAVMSGAKKKSLQTVCMSNLSQIGKAHRLYADDFDDKLPPFPAESGRGRSLNMVSQPGLLKKVLLAYTGSEEVFYCPADQHKKTAADTGWGDTSLHTSYMHAHDIGGLRIQESTWLDLTWASVPSQSLYNLFSDRYMEVGSKEATPHGDLTCSVFFDLHAECYTPAKFIERLGQRENPK